MPDQSLQSVTLVLADDHLIVRQALRLLLEAHGAEVLAEAGTFPAAQAAVLRHEPDVLLLDLRLPDGSTLGLLDALRLRGSRTHTLILSEDDDPRSVRAVMAGGAHGYVSKTASEQEVVSAVQSVAAGQVHVDPVLGARLVRLQQGRLRRLAPEDVDVLRLIALGYTAREIALTLGVSQRHVEWQRSRLQRALEAPNRAALVRVALDEGLLRRPLHGVAAGSL